MRVAAPVDREVLSRPAIAKDLPSGAIKMKEPEVIIKESRKGLINIIIVMIFISIMFGFVFNFYSKTLVEKLILGFLTIIGLIASIYCLISLISNNSKIIFSKDGFWHRDIKEMIKWKDIRSYHYEVAINEGIDFLDIIIFTKSGGKNIKLNVNLIDLSVENINEIINSYRGDNEIVYKGVIKK